MTVAAIYIDPIGPYPEMAGVDCWDARRDARRYWGPHPVVAHPPCARWCKMAKSVEARTGHRVGDDGGLFRHALAVVRRFGGVLEHPAWSLAWPHFGLTDPPAHGWLRVGDREWVCEVAQSAYGHEGRKLTWLLVAGIEQAPPAMRWDKPRGKRLVTHFAQRHTGDFNDTGRGHGQRMRAKTIHLTPPAFALDLVALARLCRASPPHVRAAFV